MFSLTEIRKRLFSLADKPFRDFNAGLIPNIDKDAFIGVKTPALKSLARELVKSGEAQDFLLALPHEYFEENQLHAFIISELRDYALAMRELERFLPYIDNWATCDQLIIKAFSKCPERLVPQIDLWLESGHTYTVRFAVGLLMRYFLNERFDTEYSDRVAGLKSDEYYVNMMSAWYFATALAKHYDSVLPYFKEKKLPIWVHNKAIQKARESYRVSPEHKSELLKLKI